jgi:hypothetical protein
MKLYNNIWKLLPLVSLFAAFSAQAYELTGYKWDSASPGTGAAITWGFAANHDDCRVDPSACRPGVMRRVSSKILENASTFEPVLSNTLRGFDVWEEMANVHFEYTDNDPDILVGQRRMDGVGGTLAQTTTSFLPSGDELDRVNQSDVVFDNKDFFALDFDLGASELPSFHNALTHEIGHALGLSHSSDPDSLMYSSISDEFLGPQADDIAGMQFLYGTGAQSELLLETEDINLDTSDLQVITYDGVQAVPLPAAFWLMLSGCGVITAIRKRIA